MAEDHEHSMYVTATTRKDGVTTLYRKCHYCDHTDEVTVRG